MQFLNANELEEGLKKQLEEMPKINMLGDRYYCILTNEILYLFHTEE